MKNNNENNRIQEHMKTKAYFIKCVYVVDKVFRPKENSFKTLQKYIQMKE